MTQIANAAPKLLPHLKVYDCRKALDGPGGITLLQFLASAENGAEDEVVRAAFHLLCDG
jgi:hypothetical protein